jgi:hypothetical protein
MSLLPFALYTSISNGVPNTDPAISANLVSKFANISTISTTSITLDGNTLDTTGTGGSATLLLNGLAIATASNVSTNIANWSLYQATSSITYATGGGTGGSIVMCNGIYSNVSTNTGSVNALTISTLNGQTLGQFGQSVLYRNNALISTVQFNTNTVTASILSFANPLPGKTIQGYINADFGGTVAGSNSSGNSPYYSAFLTDNPTFPYSPSNSIGGIQYSYFYPVGVNNIGNVNGQYNWNVNIPFAFSNSPSNLTMVWSEQNTPVPSLSYNSVSTNFVSVVGGATVSAV